MSSILLSISLASVPQLCCDSFCLPKYPNIRPIALIHPVARFLKIFVEEGASDIPVGKPLAIIVEEESDIAAFKDYDPDATDDSSSSAQPSAEPSDETPAEDPPSSPEPSSSPSASSDKKPTPQPVPTPSGSDDRVLASPLARITASAAGLSLSQLSGTGPGGRVIAADVADALAQGSASLATATSSPQAPSSAADGLPAYTDVDVTKFKRVTAERLLKSKTTIPHYYVSVECMVDNMLSMRSTINSRAKDGQYKISVNDFVIKAAAAALRKVPEVNSQWMGDKIRRFHSADISVAVQTEQGLITPIVKDADRKGLIEISQNVRSLAAKAKENTLEPEEFMGGTFTISNLGMYGVSSFSAIVNPPQAAILAVGTSEKRVLPDESSESGFATKTVMNVTLSCDHRVVDGAVGAQWLQAFKSCLEDPVNIIM